MNTDSKRPVNAKRTTEDFITDARAVHGHRYDYSRAVYISRKDKVEVVCQEHGSFWPTPGNHIGLKSGCPACKGVKRTTIDDFLRRAKEAHGDRYDYSKVDYFSVMKKVTIICPEHGEFQQIPMDHIKGRGCQRCGFIQVGISGRNTLADFITEARAVHGERYDYSRVVYTGSTNAVEIVCKTHGVFTQKPSGHLSGNGCKECAGLKPITWDEFLIRARKTHGDRYEYGKVEFKNFSSAVEIVCRDHGPFWQVPKSHVNGSGCVKCAGLEPVTRAAFIKRATAIHGERYDYSKIKIKNTSTHVEILCKEHGPFLQRPTDHLNQAQGCPECSGHRPVTKEKFLERANAVHGDRYGYAQAVYKGLKEPIEVSCALHGSFWPSPQNHVKGSGCPECAREQTTSVAENEIGEWVVSLGLSVIRNDRLVLDGLEIDVFMPSMKFGIEYNGAYWHSEERLRHPRFHELKAYKAEKKGIRLVTVWDYDWRDRPEFVKSMLLHQMRMESGPKINARDCDARKITDQVASSFYDQTHIQGSAWKSIANYGLFENAKLVAAMSFSQGSSRRGKSGDDEWELTRFSTIGSVRGGAGKLMAAFVREFNPNAIWSFSDRQHFSGGLYQSIGFQRDGNVAADYRVYHEATKKFWHKSAWQRKNIPKRLAELGIDEPFNPITDPRTEREMQARCRALRIMDAGKIRWKWTKKEPGRTGRSEQVNLADQDDAE